VSQRIFAALHVVILFAGATAFEKILTFRVTVDENEGVIIVEACKIPSQGPGQPSHSESALHMGAVRCKLPLGR
jgi:hypothetical protein